MKNMNNIGQVPDEQGRTNEEQSQGTSNENDCHIKGTCITMCPNSEIRLRQSEDLIHPLECKVNERGQRLDYMDSKRMVKEFSRSAAGQEIKAADVRCLPVLRRTVQYLLSAICAYEDASWREIYNFVDDRLRAVRQDITVQGIRGKEAIRVLAPMARFYSYAHYRLCEYELSEFDPYFSLQRLNEIVLTIISTLQDSGYSLHLDDVDFSSKLSLSPDVSDDSPTASADSSPPDINVQLDNCHIDTPPDAATGFDPPYSNIKIVPDIPERDFEEPDGPSPPCDSHALYKYSVAEEMIALYILINIGNADVLASVLEMPKSIRSSPLVSRVTEASLNWMKKNHLPLIRLSSALPPVLAMALHVHLNKVQRQVLGVLSVSHNSKILNYASEDLKSHLLFGSLESLQKAAQHYGLSTSSQGVQFVKAHFEWGADLLKSEKADWIENKLQKFTIAELLLGY